MKCERIYPILFDGRCKNKDHFIRILMNSCIIFISATVIPLAIANGLAALLPLCLGTLTFIWYIRVTFIQPKQMHLCWSNNFNIPSSFIVRKTTRKWDKECVIMIIYLTKNDDVQCILLFGSFVNFLSQTDMSCNKWLKDFWRSHNAISKNYSSVHVLSVCLPEKCISPALHHIPSWK